MQRSYAATAPMGRRPYARELLIMETVICGVASLALALLAYRSDAPAWSVAAAAIFCWAVALVFRLNSRAGVLFIPIIIGSASSLVALIMIEFGADIPELGIVGQSNGCTATYVFYAIMFYWSYLWFFSLMVGPEPAKDQPISLFFDRYAMLIGIGIVGFTILICAYLILGGLRNGFPLLAGIDRFVYRRLATDKIMLIALNLKWMFAFSLGMVAFSLPVSRTIKLSSSGTFAFLSLLYFLFGDKFFTQLVSVATFFAPYLYNNYKKLRRNMLLYCVIAGLLAAPAFGVTWFIYSNNGLESSEATFKRLTGRMAGQGELWYLQNELGSNILNWDQQFVENNYHALFVKDVGLYAIRTGIGPNYFSNRYAPDDIRASMMRNAGTITYTAALEPLGLAVFGWLGLVAVMVFAGLVTALTSVYLVRAIRLRSVLSGVFAVFIIVNVRSFLYQGAPWQIFGIYALKWFAVILLAELIMMAANRIVRAAPMMNRGRTVGVIR